MQPENKASSAVRLITALIGLGLVGVFVLGLAYSISTGFAGFEGGLPFASIALFVLALVLYDVWDQCIRRKK